MFDVMILNFGNATRVFHDVNRQPVAIDIGAMCECSLDDATARFLFEGQRSDTICIMRQHVDLPEKLRALFSLLKRVMTDPYEEVLSEANALVGQGRLNSPRPTRLQIREALGKAARGMCAQLAPTIAAPSLTPAKPAADDFADIADADLVEGADADDGDDDDGDAGEEPKAPAKRTRAKINSPAKSSANARQTKGNAKKRAKTRRH